MSGIRKPPQSGWVPEEIPGITLESFLRTAARASADKAAYRSDKNNDSAEKNIRSVHLILRSCAEFAPRGYFLRESSC